MRRKLRIYSALFIGAILSSGLHGQEIASRIREVQNLQPLACANAGAISSPRSSLYQNSLVASVNELRQRLAELQKELEQANLKSAVSQDLEKQVSALGEATKDPCTAARDFIEAAGPGSSRGPNTTVVVSKHWINFADVEVGNSSSSSFTIKNKGRSPIELSDPRMCDATGNCTTPIKEFAIQPTEPGCSAQLAEADQCEFQVSFNPESQGKPSAKIVIQWKQNGQVANDEVKLEGVSHVAEVAHLHGDGSGSTNPSTRAVLGFDITGATSANTEQKAFLEFNLNAPIGKATKICVDQKGLQTARVLGKCAEDRYVERQDPLNRRWWWYFNPRITSLAQDKSALSSLNIQGVNDFFSSKKTDLVQGVDLQGGVEWLIVKPREGLPFFSSYKNARARIGLAWIAGTGFTSPFSSFESNPAVFSLSANSPLRHQFQVSDRSTGQMVDIPASFTNIAFVSRERSRFFRKYYTGIRLKTYHFSDRAPGECDLDEKPCEALLNHFPGIIDLSVGQDEQVTAGRLMQWVFRLDAVYPLPFARGINIFGSINSVLKKNSSTNPFILPPTSTSSLSDPSVFVVNVDPRSRDIYRIGLGVDILEVLKRQTTPSTTSSKQATSGK